MDKNRSAVYVFFPVINVGSACIAGGSSSLHKRMNAATRLMLPLQCGATYLKTSQRLLQHGSNTQRTQALARRKQRTAQHARRCSRTCTFFTRPRVTRCITNPAQPHVLSDMCISAGAVASRWHANATQRKMRSTRPKTRYSTKMEPRGGSAACRRCNRCAKNRDSVLISWSGRTICARSSSGSCSLPSATRAMDAIVPMR